MSRQRLITSTILSVAMLFGTLAIGPTSVGAQTNAANPRGVSCAVTPGDPGINEQISYNFNGTTEPIFLRAVTPAGSSYLASIFPGGETSSAIRPLGYLARYRVGSTVIDIPCSSNDPGPSTNPANVSCTAAPSAGGTLVALDEGDLDNGALNVRRSTNNGNSAWLATVSAVGASSVQVPGGTDGIFVRYRVGSDVFEVSCDSAEPAGITCEYFTIGGDQIGLTVTGAPNGLELFVRQSTQAGSRFIAAYNPDGNTLPTSDSYFVRYRKAGQVFETGCALQAF